MAISPNVNAYMQQEQQPEANTVDSVFTKTFTDQSYNILQAKYPVLANAIVTFKVLDMSTDKGNALGVFIIRYGDNVRYIPTVMSGGTMVSCEMVYNKEEDTMSPLTNETIKDLATQSTEKNHSLLDKNVKVEDTRQLFRNLVRPPVSSNVLMASARIDVSDLPNKAKDALFSYLSENPKLLSKMAEFYPVVELAKKLRTNVFEKVSEKKQQNVVTLENLTKESAQSLNNFEKQRVREKGYIIKNAEDKKDVVVLDKNNVKQSFETEFNAVDLAHYCRQKCNCFKYMLNPYECRKLHTDPLFLCEVLCTTGDSYYWEEALCVQKKLYFKNRSNLDLTGVAKNIRTVTDLSEIKEYGVVNSLPEVISKSKNSYFTIIFPTKLGTYKSLEPIWNREGTTAESGGEQYAYLGNTTVTATAKLLYGCLQQDANNLLVPAKSVYLVQEDNQATKHVLIQSISQLVGLITRSGISIKVRDDNVAKNVTVNTKTASFPTNGGVAEYLHGMFKLSEDQVDQVLQYKDAVLFGKTADIMQPQQPQLLPQGNVQQPAQQPLMQQAPQMQPMQDFAAMEDPEIMDVGMLSSFSQEPDIKAMLVDYMPDFINVLDRVGRIILLFNINKQDLEDFYGAEKYSSLLGSCRRVFKIVGELTNDLKKYINMA